jgi:basic membrane lipoprotein Med (substrate-binding protein (PBP1-ABC) superfamily)
MRQVNMTVMTVSILLAAAIAGCASGPSFNQSSEASKSAIRAAEEVGATKLPSASLYLQLAKEELESAKGLAAEGKKEQAASLLTRAEADAELAVTLSHEQAEKTEAENAMERVRQLRIDNQLPIERSNP